MINNVDLIESKKVNLISIISQIYNYDVLIDIENLIMNSKIDWWDTISDEEKNAVEEGLEDIKNGNVLTHEQVMDELRIKYKELVL